MKGPFSSILLRFHSTSKDEQDSSRKLKLNIKAFDEMEFLQNRLKFTKAETFHQMNIAFISSYFIGSYNIDVP